MRGPTIALLAVVGSTSFLLGNLFGRQYSGRNTVLPHSDVAPNSAGVAPGKNNVAVDAVTLGASTGKEGVNLTDYPPVASFDPTKDFVLTYESCLASLDGSSRAKTLQRPIHWLHFPKCGTSFGAVLYGYLCQYDESPFTSPETGYQPGTNCTYCGRRGKNHQHPTLWDPHLRKLIPFEKIAGSPAMQFCDWSVPPPKHVFTNHHAMTWDWKKHRYIRVRLFCCCI